MKKILAGVLAAASMLSLSATAFASTDKTVSKTGELTYDVAVTAPKVVLNLTLPAKMAAALNPYGADVKLGVKGDDGADLTSKAGIASVAYKVTNKSKDYGVYIDATGLTTVKTTDQTAWKVTTSAPTDGTKSAQLTLQGAADPDDLKDTPTVKTSSAAATGAASQGVLVLNSEAAADSTKGLVAGQVKQAKMLFVPAKTDTADGVAYMGFVGALAKSSSSQEVEWKEDDAINVNLVLKVGVGPKTL